jgi:hypothetical protein
VCLNGWFSAVLCFQLEVADWLSQHSFFFCCFAFVTVSLYGDLFHVYETLVQFSLHSGRDGNALA